MKINRNNYESYFIDYLEGNLEEKLVDDFIEFLQQNPDLKRELSLFNQISITSEKEKIIFSQKDRLYKEKYDREEIFNKAAIDRLEGEITTDEDHAFTQYLTNHPAKEKEATLFSHTKLLPDKSIVFNKKQKLYRHRVGKTFLIWSVRIAAIFVIAFFSYLLLNDSKNEFNSENKITSFEKNNSIVDIDLLAVKTDTTETHIIQKNKIEKTIKSQNPVATPPKDKPETKDKEIKSVRETTKGRMEEDDLASHRIPVEIPVAMNSITISLKNNNPDISFGKMTLQPIQEPIEDEKFIAEIVKEKTGFNKLSINKIKQSSLNLISNITKDNLSYETNENGKITEINYDSRLLAFSIPTNRK